MIFAAPRVKKLSINACRFKNFWQSLQGHQDILLQAPEKHLFVLFPILFLLSVHLTGYEIIMSVPVSVSFIAVYNRLSDFNVISC